jgi:uncharacterized membrane protein
MLNSNAQSSDGQARSRYESIDILRALAIILMIIFHGSYDLNLFGYVSINFGSDPFWWTFPRVIVFLFLLPMGQSLQLAHRDQIKWPLIKKRMIKLSLCAVIISVATYAAFPSKWIYFGTLHCIAVCTLLALPFLDRPILSLITSLVIGVPLLFGFKWPWPQMEHSSMDYIPALPWLGVVLLGIFTIKLNLHRLPIPNFPLKGFFLKIAKHSLLIYLVHQPVLFALVWLCNKFFPAHP